MAQDKEKEDKKLAKIYAETVIKHLKGDHYKSARVICHQLLIRLNSLCQYGKPLKVVDPHRQEASHAHNG